MAQALVATVGLLLSQASVSTIQLNGQVVDDANGAGVPNVRVILKPDCKEEAVELQAQASGDDGKFTFSVQKSVLPQSTTRVCVWVRSFKRKSGTKPVRYAGTGKLIDVTTDEARNPVRVVLSPRSEAVASLRPLLDQSSADSDRVRAALAELNAELGDSSAAARAMKELKEDPALTLKLWNACNVSGCSELKTLDNTLRLRTHDLANLPEEDLKKIRGNRDIQEG